MSPGTGRKAQAKKRGTTRAKKARKASGGKKVGATRPLPPEGPPDPQAFRSAPPRPRTPMTPDTTDDADPRDAVP